MKKGLRNVFQRVVKFGRRCLGGGRRRRGLERPSVTSDSSQEQKQGCCPTDRAAETQRQAVDQESPGF